MHRENLITILLTLSLLLFCGWAGWQYLTGSGTANSSAVLTKVERKSFPLYVSERGVVRPAKIFSVSSSISSNQSKIVWLIPEGTLVRKGVIIARFDSKPFMDALQKAEQAVADAEATLLASEKMHFLQREEEAGKEEEANRKVAIAKIEADNVLNGSGPLKRKTIDQQLLQAERLFAIAESELNDLEVLLSKGHISQRERDKAADKVATGREQVVVARAERDNFSNYTWLKMQKEAELLVSAAASNLERVMRTGEIQVQNRAAEVEKNRRDLVNKTTLLQNAKTDIVNCDIYAPADGILLYPELPRDNGKRKIQIGDSVWMGQTFLEIPDTSGLVVELQIREVDVTKTSQGMRVEVEVDAFPGNIFTGEVEAIASLGTEDRAHNQLRQFPARVKLIGETGKIHVGMSVSARIVYRQVQESLVVPISSLVYRGNQIFVKRVEGEKIIEVPIALGDRGELEVEVLSGLQEGEVVVQQEM